MAKIVTGTGGCIRGIYGSSGDDVYVSTEKPSKCFHGGGDTYANQKKYVDSLGNKWASENFEATRPYFA